MTNPPTTEQDPVPTHLEADETANANVWAMATHLAALTGYLGNGVGVIVGPLVVWLIKRETMPLVDDQGREALNFNFSIGIYMICCIPLIVLFGLGIVLMIALSIFHLVFTIIAAVKANEGEAYRYPLTIRFIK